MRPRPIERPTPGAFRQTAPKETAMKYATLWSVALLLVMSLAGCSANTKFNDDEYRPLGDPRATRDA